MDLKVWRFERTVSDVADVFGVVEGRGGGGGVNSGVSECGFVPASGNLSFLVNCLWKYGRRAVEGVDVDK